jgi:hypothetical protein
MRAMLPAPHIGGIFDVQLHDRYGSSNVILHSGTLSSFVFRFCALRAQKRNADKGHMLPQAE